MKTILTTSAAVLAIACASGPEERSPSAEQRERIAEQRAYEQREEQRAEQQLAEPGNEPIPSQFDRDGDGQVENVELRQAGVSQGAIDRLDDKDDGDKDDRVQDGDDARPEATDAEITHRIREKIAARDDLSAKAKSVQISTTNGKVRLSGPVESAEEKVKVESCAREVAGADGVDNRIGVPR